jgi:hypothetical protein
VPAGAGTLWTVFELNGATITPINTLSFQFPPASVATEPVRSKSAGPAVRR